MEAYKILTQTDFTGVSLDEAKQQCRRLSSYTAEDEYFSSLILVAADFAQTYLNYMLTAGTVSQYMPYGGVVHLYGGNVTSITSVVADGVELVVDEDYVFNEITEEIAVLSDYSDITITYAVDGMFPQAVKHGILMLISTMYNNREDFITGLSVESLPLTAKQLFNMSRRYVS